MCEVYVCVRAMLLSWKRTLVCHLFKDMLISNYANASCLSGCNTISTAGLPLLPGAEDWVLKTSRGPIHCDSPHE